MQYEEFKEVLIKKIKDTFLELEIEQLGKIRNRDLLRTYSPEIKKYAVIDVQELYLQFKVSGRMHDLLNIACFSIASNNALDKILWIYESHWVSENVRLEVTSEKRYKSYIGKYEFKGIQGTDLLFMPHVTLKYGNVIRKGYFTKELVEFLGYTEKEFWDIAMKNTIEQYEGCEEEDPMGHTFTPGVGAFIPEIVEKVMGTRHGQFYIMAYTDDIVKTLDVSMIRSNQVKALYLGGVQFLKNVDALEDKDILSDQVYMYKDGIITKA